MTAAELGTARIVFETPEGETESVTVDNEHIAFFQEHWLFAYDVDDEGNDIVRRVPHQRVYYVERSVERLEEQFDTAVDKAKDKIDEIRD